MRTRSIVVVVTCVVTLLAVLGGAPAGATRDSRPTLECGDTPTTDVVLRHDLTCSTAFHFEVDFGSPPVDIDLNGYTLSFVPPSGTCDVLCAAVYSAGSIHNGSVVGPLTDIGSIYRVRVQGRVQMGLPIGRQPEQQSITRSAVEGNVTLWDRNEIVDHNVISGTVDLQDSNGAVSNATVTRNWIIAGDERGGIVAYPLASDLPNDMSGTFSRNIILGAAGPGIAIGGGSWNMGPTTIEDNILAGNDSDGIRIGMAAAPFPPGYHSAGVMTIRGNLALGNAGRGINISLPASPAAPTIIDGGHNRAIRNGTSPQCVGIICTPTVPTGR